MQTIRAAIPIVLVRFHNQCDEGDHEGPFANAGTSTAGSLEAVGVPCDGDGWPESSYRRVLRCAAVGRVGMGPALVASAMNAAAACLAALSTRRTRCEEQYAETAVRIEARIREGSGCDGRGESSASKRTWVMALVLACTTHVSSTVELPPEESGWTCQVKREGGCQELAGSPQRTQGAPTPSPTHALLQGWPSGWVDRCD
eukprot:scaffold35699_cov31-Tisochrysis_lutea.AAC.1